MIKGKHIKINDLVNIKELGKAKDFVFLDNILNGESYISHGEQAIQDALQFAWYYDFIQKTLANIIDDNIYFDVIGQGLSAYHYTPGDTPEEDDELTLVLFNKGCVYIYKLEMELNSNNSLNITCHDRAAIKFHADIDLNRVNLTFQFNPETRIFTITGLDKYA